MCTPLEDVEWKIQAIIKCTSIGNDVCMCMSQKGFKPEQQNLSAYRVQRSVSRNTIVVGVLGKMPGTPPLTVLTCQGTATQCTINSSSCILYLNSLLVGLGQSTKSSG